MTERETELIVVLAFFSAILALGTFVAIVLS